MAAIGGRRDGRRRRAAHRPSFVIADTDGENIAASAGRGIHKRAQREWPRITSSIGRFVSR